MAVDQEVQRAPGAAPGVAPGAGALARNAREEPVRESGAELHRAVWRLAWPIVVTMLLHTLNQFLDRFFVGSLGADSLAAVGLAGQISFMLFSIGMAVSVGTTALVARFTGARNLEEAKLAANQSLWLAEVAAIGAVLLMLPFRELLVRAMNMDAHATALCVRYFTITLIGVPALFLSLILSSVYRGVGDSVTPLWVMIGTNLVHLVGDWLLIFGQAGFPKMGVEGGAIALVLSQVVGGLLYLAFLPRTPVAGMMRVRGRLELAWAKRILGIGIPAAMQSMSRVLSMLVFTGVLARTPQGTAAVAALTIGITAESIAFMPGIGYSTAASTLTGQNLGARNPERAARAAWAALLQGLAIMGAMGVFFYVFAPQLSHLFARDDPAVLPLGVSYLRTMALSEPFLAVGMILTGALNGAGDTKAPAWAAVLSMWVIRLPLAYLLARVLPFGAVGAWWAMALSTTLGGLMVLYLFRRGRWQHVEV